MVPSINGPFKAWPRDKSQLIRTPMHILKFRSRCLLGKIYNLNITKVSSTCCVSTLQNFHDSLHNSMDSALSVFLLLLCFVFRIHDDRMFFILLRYDNHAFLTSTHTVFHRHH
ncbi:uncharacterized protein MELLADRAFT_70967 [Melampsora larici-populina 98AG31]|uniref:Uncharacterized protein n=1 Tax=Melampsora larici-populina (strain 98AG31 / pathotype 3-4-7) TaxID=747676 RepID=F4RAE1_MELLP|nr:uncharacterized protein MELLADRAFT_70967 [Melampsora larici-populina 98AG31]EGG10798.1 hypothetical protein MELLADRAFT_70967 [Melampsora larici-populina 98AG31]